MSDFLVKDLVMSQFPDGRDTSMDDIDRYIVMSLDVQFKTENDRLVAYRRGAPLLDKTTQAPLPVKTVVENYFTERSWVGDSKSQPGNSCFSQFEKEWKEKNPGKNTLSSEFVDAVSTYARSNNNFNWHN
jgi:hypothetical protein